MINKKQINLLDNLLGKCLRLSISIEFTINLIYCCVKPINEPVLLQGKNFDIYENKRFTRLYKNAEHLNFNYSLRELENLDKKYKIFSIKQYRTLQLIRENRNAILHETTCPYLFNYANDEKKLIEYNNDIKKLKSFISLATQYDKLTQRVLSNLLKPKKSSNFFDGILITGIETYKLK